MIQRAEIRTTMLGFVPLGRFYYCIQCQHDLSAWVMKQSPDRPSACPQCDFSMKAEHIAQAQRETKIGCLLTLIAFASLFLILAAIVIVIRLM